MNSLSAINPPFLRGIRRLASVLSGGEVMAFEQPMDTEDFNEFEHAVLGIETDVSVTLATKRVSLQQIVNLVPGSMLTFDAHCDEPLTLEVGGQPIATGETVKIGDKFGLRIRDILETHRE